MTAHSETRPHGRFLDLRRDLCVRLPAILAHRVAAHLNAVRVVNQPIENAVGGGGVAGLSTDRLQAFTNAADLALEALDSPQCAAVFNTSGTGSHTAQEVLEAELPFSVLINLRPGTEPTFYIGSINFGLLPADQIANMQVAGNVPGTGWTVGNIWITTREDPTTGYFFNADPVAQATTILHELGHVFAEIAGLEIINERESRWQRK